MSRDDGWSWRGSDFKSRAAITKTKPWTDCFNQSTYSA
jgi:hypothetical protein